MNLAFRSDNCILLRCTYVGHPCPLDWLCGALCMCWTWDCESVCCLWMQRTGVLLIKTLEVLHHPKNALEVLSKCVGSESGDTQQVPELFRLSSRRSETNIGV